MPKFFVRLIAAIAVIAALCVPGAPANAATTPGAPTAVVLTAGADSLSVRWTAPTVIGDPVLTSYTASAFADAVSGSAVSSCTSVAAVTSCTIDGLTAGTTYYVGVTATNGSATSAESTRVSDIVGTVPGAPKSVSVSRALSGAITVEWEAPTSTGGTTITSYTASAYTSTSSSAAVAGSCTTSGLTCVIDGMAASTTYYVSVRATNTSGTSSASSRVTAGPVSSPTAPQNVKVTRGNGFAQVKWSAPSSTGGSKIIRYVVEAFHVAQGGDPIALCEPEKVTTLQCNIGPLLNGGTYFIQVTAYNNNGAGESSAPRISITTGTTPAVPRDVTAVRAGGAVEVAWRVPEADGGLAISSYVATAFSAPSGGTSLGTCTTDGPSCQITGLTGGPVYVEVYAKNDAGSSPTSSPRIRVRVLDRVDVPLAVAGSARTSGIAATWLPPLDDGGSIITSYKASAFTTPSGGTEVSSCTLPVTRGFQYAGRPDRIGCTIKTLQADVIYYLEVAATNEVGTTVTPERTAVRVRQGKALAPRTVLGLPGRDRLAIIWALPASDGGESISEYRVYGYSTEKGTDPDFECKAGGDAARTTFSCHLTNTPDFEPTWVEVVAKTARGWGQASTRVAFESKPSVPTPPQRVQLTAKGGDIAVSWEKPFFDGGYPVYNYVASAYSAKSGGEAVTSCTVSVDPKTAKTKTPSTKCTLTDVAEDTYMWVEVTAENTVGFSAPSERVGEAVLPAS